MAAARAVQPASLPWQTGTGGAVGWTETAEEPLVNGLFFSHEPDKQKKERL